MATQFKPLSLELIGEGKMMVRANEELLRLQKAMIDFMKEHGKDVKCSAKLVMEVTLMRDPKMGDDTVGVIDKIKATLPTRPAGATLALAGESQTDEPCLLVRSTGSSNDSPRQAILATSDGRAVDPATGEVIES